MNTRKQTCPSLPAADIEHVLRATASLWEEMRGERLFITGGTGFIGSWLLETFLAAVNRYDLGARVVVLTRDPRAFSARLPHLAGHPALTLIEGDVKTFSFPSGTFRFAIHAATQASARLNQEQPLEMLDSIVAGTRRALEFVTGAGTCKMLLTSSGAVYGRQPWALAHVSEEHAGGPLPGDTSSAYGEGKRVAELLCAIYGRSHPQLEIKIARCFAFVGPHLPLDTHFAIGNFIRDVLARSAIRISGDGTPLRSYLYAADMAVWLWTVLFSGASLRPYNVGSERAVSISDVARTVCEVDGGGLSLTIGQAADPSRPPERYVPSTERARVELNLREEVALNEAIRRTIAWNRMVPTIVSE
jgi:nucleoside-diphosphate-sugar epimerase